MEVISRSVSGTYRLLQRKAVSGETAVYVVNAVLIPAIVHRTAVTTLSTDDCTSLDRCWLKVVKRKSGLASSCPNDLASVKAGLCVRYVQDEFNQAQIADLARRLNASGILGITARAQEEAATYVTSATYSPYERYVDMPARRSIYGLPVWTLNALPAPATQSNLLMSVATACYSQATVAGATRCLDASTVGQASLHARRPSPAAT